MILYFKGYSKATKYFEESFEYFKFSDNFKREVEYEH